MDRTPQQPAPADAPLSAMLLELARQTEPDVTVGALVDRFGARAFGALLFLFAAPNLLPLPPGSSTVLAAPLLLIAPQLALGARKPWLPKALLRRKMPAATLSALCAKAAPWVARIERLSSRRLPFLLGRPGGLVVGLVCTLLAAVLVLPIPFGNMLPGSAIAVLGISLVQRDGLLTLVGYALAGASAAVLVLSGQVVLAAVRHLEAWIAAI